jgi:hypothetical protein
MIPVGTIPGMGSEKNMNDEAVEFKCDYLIYWENFCK